MPTPKWESLVTLLLLAAASISSATDCPAGSTRFLHQSDAIYCYSLHGDLGIDRLNWIDAQTACRNLGANSDLVSIQDQSEQNTLMVAIQAANFGTVRFWIGYNDRAVEGSFVWTDGTPSFFTNWNAVEPSNGGGNGGGNEDCVETLNAAGEWNDVPCTLTRPHICKLVVQEPLPNITSVTSTMGDSPFRNSTTVTYECIARRDTGDEVIFWLGPDGRNASDSARITVEQTQPTSTTLNLTMVITEFQAENSGQYTCVVRNNAREANQTVNIGFQECPAGSTRFQHQNGATYCYSLHGAVNAQRLNQSEALATCRGLGANSDLVSIQDQSEQNAVLNAIQEANFNTNEFWIGYNDLAVENSFVWTDGTPSFFTNWNAGEPNNGGGNEDCVEILSADGEWNDAPCRLLRPHICKLVVQEPLPNITSVTSTMGDSPFRFSTTVTYECIARRDTGDEVIFWLGPDGRNASDSARITSEQTQPTITTLNLTMVITEGQEENSGQYTCVVRNNAREANQTVNIGFQECPAGSTRFQHQNGATYCYSLHGNLSSERLIQSEALAACRGLGANSDLVSIQDQSEKNAVLNAIQEANFNTNAFWIGYTDVAVENSFVWTDGTPSFFTNWFAGQPGNKGGNEHCVEILNTAGEWNDVPCTFTRAHICKLVVQEPLPNITSVTSIVGDSPFLSSTTVTYECIARRETGDEVIFWLGPDGRNASDSARITVEQTQPTSTTLILTMVITEGRVENSGQYTCVVRNIAREANQTASIAFQVILALDGVTGNPFPIQFTEGSRELELLSFQHVALLIGQEPICSVSLQLTNSGPLNDPSVERIVPTKVIDDDSGELMTSQDLIRYNKASPYSPQDLLTILRNQEYFNFANEFTVGQRTVTWTIGICGSNVTVATGITTINLVHVNDNPPVIELRSASVVV